MQFLCQSCGQCPFPSLRPSGGSEIPQPNYYKSTHVTGAQSYQFRLDTLSLYTQSLQKELDTATRALESLRTPISRVTDDIFLCIFDELFSNYVHDDDDDDGPEPAKTYDIHTFTLVSKHWRRIITSTPKFWATISLPPRYGQNQRISNSFSKFLEIQLRRAGKLPMTLEIFQELSSRLTNTLKVAFHRIMSLDVVPNHYKDLKQILDSCSLLPNLSHLSIKLWAMSSAFDPHFQIDAEIDLRIPPVTINLSHDSVPHLTSVEITLQHPLEKIILPWSQLTHLKIGLLDGGDIDPWSIVAGLGMIENLQLQLGCNQVDPGVNRPLLPLPRLHTLSLTGFEQDNFSFQLLQQSNLQSLQELRLRLLGGGQQFIATLNTPRLWTLTKLELHFFTLGSDSMDIEGVISSFRGFSCIEVFRCNMNQTPYLAHRIIQGLSLDDPSTGFLFPCLEILEIKGAHFEQETVTFLVELLRNRMNCIGMQPDERKTLRTLLISYESGSTHSPRFSKQIFRPRRYNDRVTSVTLEAKGEYPRNFLRDIFADFQLFER